MTTENQIQVNLNRFKSKKQNLGTIEDAISSEVSRIEGEAQDYIQQSLKLYSLIEDFFLYRDNLLSELSQAQGINMDKVYSLIEEIDNSKQYNVEFDSQSYLSLVDIESIVDGADQVSKGLGGIRVLGLG